MTLTLVALLVLVAPFDPAVANDAAAPARRHAAAERGVDYLIAREGEMPADWRLEIFDALARRLPPGAQRERCREIADAARSEPITELPEELTAHDLRWPRTIRRIMKELIRRGPDPGPLRDRLAELLADHEASHFAKLNPTQQLITLHQLAKLGIPTKRSAEDVIRHEHERWDNEPREALLLEPKFVFAITHVAIIASNYFEKRPALGAFPTEVEILEQAAAHYAEGIPDGKLYVDVAGEVVIARRLLGVPESRHDRAILEQLLEQQEEDGRWGQQRLQLDIHATLVAAEALAPWPDHLRTLTPDHEAQPQ